MIKAKAKGFTLIELVMVIAIIAIISVSGAYLMLYLVQNSVVIPNKLNMDMIACEALDIMIEGDRAAGGLRFSRSITDIKDNEVSFNNQDGQSIVFKLDTVTEELSRSIDGLSPALIPYYATGVSITGEDNKLFTYYDQSDNEIDTGTGDPEDVRQIKVGLITRTGSGAYADWQGRSAQTSSITVRKFE